MASAGGHFVQLMQIRSGLAGHAVTYATTAPGLAAEFGALPAVQVPDCNADTPLRALAGFLVTGWHMARIRPHVVVTTGALPGVMAILWGRLLGARTLWVDSIANAETLSASGRIARKIAHVTLSQWPAVAEAEGVQFRGAVL